MKFWIALGCVLIATAAGVAYVTRQPPVSVANALGTSGPEEPAEQDDAINARVIRPRKGAMEHKTVQSGSIQAYETVQIYAKASGYLKAQPVDIGDRVKRGQVLAVVDVPELEKTVQKNAACVEQANARVAQFKARVASAKADHDAALAGVVQSEASAKSAGAWVRFRDKQLGRMKELFALKSIDERLVDETRERFEAAVETENASKAAILTAKAQVSAAHAKIQQADADVLEAQSQVKVAQAEVERSQVLLDFATVTAPFDGVISHRRLYPGDFVRSASESGTSLPLLTLQRVDRMRVIVQVPDVEVPFTDPGDAALVEIDALPGEKLKAKVSRIANSEDAQTRQMHIEIDLPNPTGRIREGMYGRVTIQLENSAGVLSIPSACLVGKAQRGLGMVYVVRQGLAQPVRVRLGADDGVRVTILQGVTERDDVIFQPSSGLSAGARVNVIPHEERAAPIDN